MSPRILVAFAVVAVSCGDETSTTEALTPRVDLESTLPGQSGSLAEAFAFELQDPTSPGVSTFTIDVTQRESHMHCRPGGKEYDRDHPVSLLSFSARSNTVEKEAHWVPNANGASEVSEEATAGSATTRHVADDHVEVAADFTFPSGSIKGTLVATICR